MMAIVIVLGIMGLTVGIGLLLLGLPATKGWAGEKLVAWRLRWLLPKGTVIMNDLYFRTGRRSCQIDHLVVSPRGVFVFETKNYLGLVYGDAEAHDLQRAVLGMRYSCYNPVRQNERHLDYLRTYLPAIRQRAEALRSIVVFVPFSRLRLRNNPGNVGSLWRLRAMIRHNSQPDLLSEDECQAIANELRRHNRRRA